MNTGIINNSRWLSFTLLAALFGLGSCHQSPGKPSKAPPKKEQGVRAEAGGAHLGELFSLSEITPLEKILSHPKEFEGKTVLVQGVVTSHCHHRLAWFGLKSDEAAKGTLRVVTAPRFLVPRDIKHGITRASAQGVVEVHTVPEAQARHLAREHGLFGGDPDKVSGPQYLPSLGATGATFR